MLIPQKSLIYFVFYIDQNDDQSDPEEEKPPDVDSPSPCIVYVSQRDPMVNTSTIEEIPAKEPHPMNAMPKKSALKKKGPLTCADFQKLSIVQNRYVILSWSTFA